MTTLQRILLRDLWRLRGQVITISLVVASGIAAFITMRCNYDSIEDAKVAYYEQHRFGDVFAHLSRAPDAVLEDIRSIRGVAAVTPRVVEHIRLPLDGMTQPAQGRVVSLAPEDGVNLNAIYLRVGRRPEARRGSEVLVLDAFAKVHGIVPGDTIPVVLNGVLRQLRVVGVAMSPEYVFALDPGSLSHDPERFAVLWMNEDALRVAFDLDGAFNDVTLSLQPGASNPDVRAALDRILEPYGSLGAYSRDRQLSALMVDGELSQLRSWAIYIPIIFLGVAAFLLNVVLSRLVHLQRPQIATLKAVGYDNRVIGVHYLALASVIVGIGAAIGITGGAWLGASLTSLYRDVFHFPTLRFQLDVRVISLGLSVSMAAAALGALQAVRSVVRLPPAEAMRPPAPARYRRALFERLGLMALFSPSGRMVLRELERRPLRALLSVIGIAMAVAILVIGRFSYDSVSQLVDVQFRQTWREDLAVTFRGAAPARASRTLAHLPGVLRSEGFRAAPARLRHGARYRDIAIMGHPDDADLRTVRNRYAQEVALPLRGLVLSRKLADILGVVAGQYVSVELREGDHRAPRQVLVANTIDDAFGLQGIMRLSALQQLLRESDTISGAWLRIDARHLGGVQRYINEMPFVAGADRRQNALERFDAQSGTWMLTVSLIMAAFASTIAVGVVYNNARVALSMRHRDLASLRVLGFTRREISRVLLSELAVQVIVAIPVGLFAGVWMSYGVAATVDPELYRLPVSFSGQTYGFATLVTVASGLASALLVRRRLDKLDLIGVLKSRE